ncbi:MAG: ABC transporter permease [Planctomycetota bacterium]
MQYRSFLTWRLLTSRFLPLAAVVAVAFGVFCLIPVLSVMEGFKQQMRGYLRGALSDISVTGDGAAGLYHQLELEEALAKIPHVAAYAPYVEGIAILDAREVGHCAIRGIDPIAESQVSNFARYLLRGSEIRALLEDSKYTFPADRQPLSPEELEFIFSLKRRQDIAAFWQNAPQFPASDLEPPPQPIVVGIEAFRSGIFTLGQTKELITLSPVTREPRSQTFLVVGVFQTKLFEQDLSTIYMPIAVAQNFLALEEQRDDDYKMRFTGFSIRLDDFANAPAVLREIDVNGIGPFRPELLLARSWEQHRGNLLKAVDSEKTIITAMMMLIVAFAGVVIFLILTVMVIEKTRDLGVLRSLGATPRGVVMMFLRMGMVLCILGTVLGVTCGYLLTSNINAVHDFIHDLTGRSLFPPDIYYFTEIPVAYRWFDWATILAPTIALGFLASLIPAVWAARQDPVKTLRHE